MKHVAFAGEDFFHAAAHAGRDVDFVHFDRSGDGVAFALASGQREDEGEEEVLMELERQGAASLSISGEKSKIFPQPWLDIREHRWCAS